MVSLWWCFEVFLNSSWSITQTKKASTSTLLARILGDCGAHLGVSAAIFEKIMEYEKTSLGKAKRTSLLLLSLTDPNVAMQPNFLH